MLFSYNVNKKRQSRKNFFDRLTCTFRQKYCINVFMLNISRAIQQRIACLHFRKKWPFGGPAFIRPFRAIVKAFKKIWLAGKKPVLQKSHFVFWTCKQANTVLHMNNKCYNKTLCTYFIQLITKTKNYSWF